MLLLKISSIFFVFAHVTSVPLDCEFLCTNGLNTSNCECSQFMKSEDTSKAAIEQNSMIYYEPTDDINVPAIETSFFIPNPIHRISKKDNVGTELEFYPTVNRVLKSISDANAEQLHEINDSVNNDLYLDIDLANYKGRATEIKEQFDIEQIQINLSDCLSLQGYLTNKNNEPPFDVILPPSIDVFSTEGKDFLKEKCEYVHNIFAKASQDVFNSYPKKPKSVPVTPEPKQLDVISTTAHDIDHAHDIDDSNNYESEPIERNINDDEAYDCITFPSYEVENRVKYNEKLDGISESSLLVHYSEGAGSKNQSSENSEESSSIGNDGITSQPNLQVTKSLNDDETTSQTDFKYDSTTYRNELTDLNISNALSVELPLDSVHSESNTVTKSNGNVSKVISSELDADYAFILDTITTSVPPTLNFENYINTTHEAFTLKAVNDFPTESSTKSVEDITNIIAVTDAFGGEKVIEFSDNTTVERTNNNSTEKSPTFKDPKIATKMNANDTTNLTAEYVSSLDSKKTGSDEIKGFLYLLHNDKQIPIKFVQGSNGEIRIALDGLSFCQN